MTFGHHPNPATDFCVEVDIIEGLVLDVEAGIECLKTVEDRIFKAMAFRVGGDEMAVSAKAALRRADLALKAVAARLE